jgi:uncharacterized protein YjbI with pentapeptide repeats
MNPRPKAVLDGTELKKRWRSGSQLAMDTRALLEDIVERGAPLRNLDLRGAVLAPTDDALGGISFHDKPCHFAHRLVDGVDFSFGVLGLSFAASEIVACRFNDALLKQCSFREGKLREVSFEGAELIALSFSKASVVGVSFRRARLRDMPRAPWDAVRVVFEKCDYRDVSAHKVEFRAGRMIGCQFENAVFTECDFRGVKFEGTAPSAAQLIRCQLSGNTLDGQNLGW